MASKTLHQTELFASVPSSKRNRILRDMESGDVLARHRVNIEDVADKITTIERRFKHPGAASVASIVREGNAWLIFDEGLAIPSFIPAWLILHGSEVVTVINVTLNGRKSDNGPVDIETRPLYALMQSGWVLKTIHERYNRIVSSSTFMKHAAGAYARMALRALDRKFAVSTQSADNDLAAYMAAKFFQLYVAGREEGSATHQIAASAIPGQSTPDSLLAKENEHSPSYATVEDFMNSLSEAIPTLKDVTFRAFVESWGRMYGDSSLTAIESLGYFCAVIFGASVGGGLVLDITITGVAEREARAALTEFARLAR